MTGFPFHSTCLSSHLRGTFEYLTFAIGWGGESCPWNSPTPSWVFPEQAVFMGTLPGPATAPWDPAPWRTGGKSGLRGQAFPWLPPANETFV